MIKANENKSDDLDKEEEKDLSFEGGEVDDSEESSHTSGGEDSDHLHVYGVHDHSRHFEIGLGMKLFLYFLS